MSWKYYVFIYENGKIRHVKLFQEWEMGEIKENDGGDEL
jgi:hypothetical protein